MRILLTLTLIISLFSLTGCICETQEKLVYVNKKQPYLKNRPKRDTKIEPFMLFKKDSNITTMYLVDKKDLITASKSMQKARKIIYTLEKDSKFYRYQNNKTNVLNKETNATKKDSK